MAAKKGPKRVNQAVTNKKNIASPEPSSSPKKRSSKPSASSQAAHPVVAQIINTTTTTNPASPETEIPVSEVSDENK